MHIDSITYWNIFRNLRKIKWEQEIKKKKDEFERIFSFHCTQVLYLPSQISQQQLGHSEHPFPFPLIVPPKYMTIEIQHCVSEWMVHKYYMTVSTAKKREYFGWPQFQLVWIYRQTDSIILCESWNLE